MHDRSIVLLRRLGWSPMVVGWGCEDFGWPAILARAILFAVQPLSTVIVDVAVQGVHSAAAMPVACPSGAHLDQAYSGGVGWKSPEVPVDCPSPWAADRVAHVQSQREAVPGQFVEETVPDEDLAGPGPSFERPMAGLAQSCVQAGADAQGAPMGGLRGWRSSSGGHGLWGPAGCRISLPERRMIFWIGPLPCSVDGTRLVLLRRAAIVNLWSEVEGRVEHFLVTLVAQGVPQAGRGKSHAAIVAEMAVPGSSLAWETSQLEEG